MHRAGADQVIMLTRAGGKEMVQALIAPQVYNFMHQAFDISGFNISMEPLDINNDSPFVNKTIAEIELSSKFELLLVVYKEPKGEFIFNPDPQTVIRESSVLLIVGPAISHLSLLNYLRKFNSKQNYARDMELMIK